MKDNFRNPRRNLTKWLPVGFIFLVTACAQEAVPQTEPSRPSLFTVADSTPPVTEPKALLTREKDGAFALLAISETEHQVFAAELARARALGAESYVTDKLRIGIENLLGALELDPTGQTKFPLTSIYQINSLNCSSLSEIAHENGLASQEIADAISRDQILEALSPPVYHLEMFNDEVRRQTEGRPDILLSRPEVYALHVLMVELQRQKIAVSPSSLEPMRAFESQCKGDPDLGFIE